MERSVTKRAVLFDFDGVICQTETFRMERLKDSFEKMGLTVDKKRLYQLVGGTRQERLLLWIRYLRDRRIIWSTEMRSSA